MSSLSKNLPGSHVSGLWRKNGVHRHVQREYVSSMEKDPDTQPGLYCRDLADVPTAPQYISTLDPQTSIHFEEFLGDIQKETSA